MKILLIGMTKNKGGTETFIMNVARALWQRGGVDVFFLDTEDDGIVYKDEIISNGGKIINFKIHKGPKGLLYNRKEADYFFKNNNFDIVHVNTSVLRNAFWAVSAEKNGVKKIFVHAHNSSYGARNFIKKSVYEISGVLYRKKIKTSKIELLAASREAGQWMFRGLPFEVIDNGVDTNMYLFSDAKRNLMREKLSLNSNSIVVISVARLAYQKNQDKTIDVFSQMIKKRPNEDLLLVGDGEDLLRLKKKVKDLNIDRRVHFLGHRNDIPNLLSAADIMIFPSRYEGTPYSLMEAQSSGLPIMASLEAFRQDENITGDVSLLSLQENDKTWASAILNLFDNSKQSDRRIANKKVKNSVYSMDHFTKQIMNLYSLN